MVEKFLIDANSFMTPYRQYYAFDLVPTYWEKISKCTDSGRLILLDMVKAEIDKGKDDLADWLSKQESFVICNHISSKIVGKYQEILQYIQSCGLYKEQALQTWADGDVADPWLIAAAAVNDYVIITAEVPSGGLSIKNPNRKEEQQMVSFESDYTKGAHPKILQRLAESNLEPMPGYGMDFYCQRATEKIRAACGCPEADVYYLAGGTQANAVVISSMLRGYEGVVSAQTGHINVHEAGAIEATGRKVLALPEPNPGLDAASGMHEEHLGQDAGSGPGLPMGSSGQGSGKQFLFQGQKGKINAGELEKYLQGFYQDSSHGHMVFPGMVYVSHPTEYGTLYQKSELEGIGEVCRKYGLPLYLDGARLGYGLMSRENELSLPDIARICDVFYIGGTKVGALCGEAVVFPRDNAPKHFMTTVKQHGALLAKGRLLGVQFDALFTDGLYWELSRHAIEMAEQLKKILRETGCTFYLESPTNQQFILLEDSRLEELEQHVAVSFWEKPDESHTVVRLATSWATSFEELEELRKALSG